MPIFLTIIISLATILLSVWPKIQKYITVRKHEKGEKKFDKMIDDLSKEYNDISKNKK
jgi:hypothetical protein